MNAPSKTRVGIYGDHNSRCGYCHKTADGRASFAIRLSVSTVQHYQALLERGWRRSGTFTYRPNNEAACCPNYTIRLQASRFRLHKKKHKQVLRRFVRFLDGSWTLPSDRPEEKEEKKEESSAVPSRPPLLPPGEVQPPHRASCTAEWTARVQEAVTAAAGRALSGRAGLSLPPVTLRAPPKGVSSCCCCTAFPLALAPRLHSPAVPPATLAQTLAPLATAALRERAEAAGVEDAAALRVMASAGYLNVFLGQAENEVSRKKTKKTSRPEKHDSIPSATVWSSWCGFMGRLQATGRAEWKGSANVLTAEQVPAAFSEEAFGVYTKYQMGIHKDKEEELSRRSFTNFLCSSPLIPESVHGSFHWLYQLNGVLFAVAVVDVLPHGLSSVYFLYDPHYGALSLGVWGALVEIAWLTQVDRRRFPALEYYYMGYYLHNCVKMRYKGQYKPSELLCDKRLTWHPLEECVQLLDRARFAVFSSLAKKKEEKEEEKEEESGSTDCLPVLFQGHVIPKAFLRIPASFEALLQKYARLVGPALAREMVLQL